MNQKPMCNSKTIEISVNIGVNLHDFGFSNGFLDMTSKTSDNIKSR